MTRVGLLFFKDENQKEIQKEAMLKEGVKYFYENLDLEEIKRMLRKNDQVYIYSVLTTGFSKTEFIKLMYFAKDDIEGNLFSVNENYSTASTIGRLCLEVLSGYEDILNIAKDLHNKGFDVF